MGTQGAGRKRHPNRDRLSAEDHALNQIAREAEARLAAKRAARAEAREIRMKELERQQKEIYQVQKKYYGLDAKWGDIEQWMEDSERYSHRPRRNLQVADDDDMSVTSRSSLRTNGYEEELLGPSQYRKSSRSSTGSGETFQSSRGAPRDENAYYSDLSLASVPLPSKQQQQSVHNGSRPSLLNCNSLPSRSQRGSLYDEGVSTSSRRSSGSRPPSEYSCYLGSGSRASSRASSARASPVSSEPLGPSVYRRGSNSASVPSLSHLDDVSLPAMSRVEERSDKDFGEKGSRPVSSLSAATLASLGGTSSRRGSGDTSISVDTEASIREIKEISELKEQIEDVEGKYMQGLKEMKDSLAEVEEKYKRSMVTNAQLDNEKTSLQYQVDTLREVLLELEEELAESRRQYEEKHKENERQKHDQNVLRFQLAEMKEALEQRESLLTKHGIPLDSIGTPNGDAALEPHVNADGRPDPPIRTTSMGPSEEAVEKKETMPVVGESPPSKAEQANQGILLAAPSETPHNAEIGDKAKEQNIQEIASGSNDDVGACDTLSAGQTNLESQEGGLQLDLESSRNEYAPENVNKNVLAQNISEPQREETLEQRSTNPEETEVFQDALENVVLSPCVASEEQSIFAGDFGSKDSEVSEISECGDNAAVITDDKIDHHTETKEERKTSSPDDSSQDEHETSSNDVSSQDDSEECTADEKTTTAVEDQKVCEAEVKPDEESVHVDLGLQCKEDDSEKDSNVTCTPSDKGSVSVEATIHADIHDVVEGKKGDLSPEQSLQDVQFSKEEKQLVDNIENNNFGEVAGPCILSNRQNTFENEALEDSEALKDIVSHVGQHEDTTDAGSLNLEIPENEKTSTVVLDAKETELLNKEPAPVTELSGEGEPAKTSDLSNKIENSNDNIPVVTETPKEVVVSEPVSSEGESTPEGEESDENNDDEDVVVRSEKYTGESLSLGSSVDQVSSDDIRMEDGSDKASRRGKGKNKEDCVVS